MNELFKLNREELAERLGQTDRYNEIFCILMVLRKKGYDITSLIEKIIAPLKDKRLIAEFRMLLQMSDKSVDFRLRLNKLDEKEIISQVKRNPNLSFYILHPSVPIMIAVLKRDNNFQKYFYTNIFELMSGLKEDRQLEILTKEPELVRYLKNPSENLLIEVVKRNPRLIRYVDEPSEELQLTAVNQDGLLIQYLKNPSLNVKMNALKNNFRAILYMDDLFEICRLINDSKIKEFLVEKNGLNIQYIENPSENLQRIAIKNNGCSIQFIKNSSIPIQKLAVQRDIMAIRYINNPSLEVMLESVKNDPFSIRFLNTPPIEVQLEAVRSDGEAIKFIKNPSIDVQLEAVRQSEFAIRYIENPITEVQMESISSTKVIKHDVSTVEDRAEFKPTYAEKLKTISTENCEHLIIDWQDNLGDHINYLCQEFEVKHIKIAAGFAFRSGLELISPSFQRALNNQGTIELVIGSLQKYQGDPDNKVMGMDVATALYLNDLISRGINLRTYKNSFFHGKFYWLEGETFTSIIIGSSNISVSGFQNNRELNSLFLFSNISVKYQEFKNWFKRLWQECEEIGSLNPQCFSPMEREYHYQEGSITRVNEDDVQQKLKTLSDEEVVARMKLWLSRKPNSIYSDLGIDNLKDYLLFEYKDYDLIVFESMTPGNAYYYFYKQELNTLIKLLKQASKTEIFKLSQMHKRGYHIQNHANLEIVINNLFIKSYQN